LKGCNVDILQSPIKIYGKGLKGKFK